MGRTSVNTDSDQENPEENENATKPSPKPRADNPDAAGEAAAPAGQGAGSDSADTGSDTPASPGGATARARLLLRRLATPRTLLPLVLIMVLLACSIYFGLKWREQASLSAARDFAVASARDYATDLSSYDYTNLQGNFAKVTEGATGAFAKQYQQVSQNLTELIKQHQAVSKGTVLAAGASEVTEEHAMVTLFVDQQITNTNSPQPRIDRNRMQMSLSNQDGRWLIDDVKLL